MYCTKCGYANPPDASFCGKCGLPLMAGAAAADVATIPQGLMPLPLQAESFPEQAGAVDEEAWRALIGKNAHYYLPRFKTILAGGVAPRWHWPAFFVTWYWLLYRKMWGLALLYLIAPYVIGLVAGAVAGAAGVSGNTASGLAATIVVALFLIGPPLFANTWYFRHCRKIMAKARRKRAAARATLDFSLPRAAGAAQSPSFWSCSS